MKQKFNYHTHTAYCDGIDAPRAYIEKAIELGFLSLGFSAHAPIKEENSFSLQMSEAPLYVSEIRSLQHEYADRIEILLSLEMDYTPPYTFPFAELKEKFGLDYTIGAIHLVKSSENLWFIDGSKLDSYDKGLQKCFEGDIKKGVKAYFSQINEMIEIEKPTILGHFDKITMNNKGRYFSKQDKWYCDLVQESIELLSKTDTIVEVNTRGLYKGRSDDFFPSKDIIKQLKTAKIPITISIDAHNAEELGKGFDSAYEYLDTLGYKASGKKNGIRIFA